MSHIPIPAEPTPPAKTAKLVGEIQTLRQERNAVILAHNYEHGEIQDSADFVGDSLGLSQTAATTPADVIVFCGVHFMAETAAILSPNKTVLLPDMRAGCSLADSITAEQVRAWKAKHPDAVVVSYVNTTAEIKAESDYCCTSGNAVKVIQAIPSDRQILFLPDQFLASFVGFATGREVLAWKGSCHVHAAITKDVVVSTQVDDPNAELLVHPECSYMGAYIQSQSANQSNGNNKVHVLSTEGMLRYVQESDTTTFVVATEMGILHRMRKACPHKTFHPITQTAVCAYMKLTTLEKVAYSLREMVYPVTVEPHVAERARIALERMLQLA